MKKPTKKCTGNCPNTCRVHDGEFTFCTNEGCLCHGEGTMHHTCGKHGRVMLGHMVCHDCRNDIVSLKEQIKRRLVSFFYNCDLRLDEGDLDDFHEGKIVLDYADDTVKHIFKLMRDNKELSSKIIFKMK